MSKELYFNIKGVSMIPPADFELIEWWYDIYNKTLDDYNKLYETQESK